MTTETRSESSTAYQYNLAIPILPGKGTYKVEIQIGGTTVGTAQFDLK
jgi:hypothetical protein